MQYLNKKQWLKSLSLSVVVGLSACSSEDSSTSVNTKEYNSAVSSYSELVFSSYEKNLSDVILLKTAITNFKAQRDSTTFLKAREAWLETRESYGVTEAFRFYEGPIDDPENGVEGLLNAWPMEEGYVDYTVDANGAIIKQGLIYASDFDAKISQIDELNEQGGETNISSGYHAIEFILWGQDLNLDDGKAAFMTKSGQIISGQRPLSDFTVETYGDRRFAYLEAAVSNIITHLQYLKSSWSPGVDNYRQAFEAQDSKQSIARIFRGLQVLSSVELSGERMVVALSLHDQEDEHSCFSDNTHRDMVQGAKGMYDVVFQDNNQGLASLLSSQDSATLLELMDETQDAVEAIQAPFDYEISLENTEGNARVQRAVDALRAQGTMIKTLVSKLDLPQVVVQD